MEQKVGYRDVLSQTEYVKMMSAALINRFGDSIDAIAATWITYELTKSASWSALIYAVNTLPTVFITPLAGVWVEGRNKKRIMIITDIIRCLCVGFVATAFLLGFLQAWMLIITNLIISTVEAFRGPANTSLIPRVLDEKVYSFGMSLSSTLSSIVQLIGMGCAAGIIAAVGTSGALYIDMATFVLSALIIAFVNSGEKDAEKTRFNASEYFKNLKDGFGYVSKDSVMRFFMLYTIFLNVILVPLNSLQAPMASEVLNSGAGALSVLSIAVTVGMLLGSVTFPYISAKISDRLLSFICGIGTGLFYLILIVFKPFYTNPLMVYTVLAIASIILGMCVSAGTSLMSVIFMKKVDRQYIARAASISTAVGVAATPVASFIVSIGVSFISTSTFFVTAGILDIVVISILVLNKAMKTENEALVQVENME